MEYQSNQDLIETCTSYGFYEVEIKKNTSNALTQRQVIQTFNLIRKLSKNFFENVTVQLCVWTQKKVII